MNSKYITLNYEKYLEMESSLRKLIYLLSSVYFNEKISENIKNEIQQMNKENGWWV